MLTNLDYQGAKPITALALSQLLLLPVSFRIPLTVPPTICLNCASIRHVLPQQCCQLLRTAWQATRNAPFLAPPPTTTPLLAAPHRVSL
jgi:hypothetical protein